MKYERAAIHSGSWYTDSNADLSEELLNYIESSTTPVSPSTKAIISPHAGFSYSGSTGGSAFSALKDRLDNSMLPSLRLIIVLHPSHKVYLDGAAISNASILETPISDLSVCDETRRDLLKHSIFSTMDKQTDESEHSGEMQYPFIAQVLGLKSSVKVLPIMVGSVGSEKERVLASKLLSLFDDPSTFFVVSSDFCHWGERFDFNPHDKSKGKIHEYIKWLDSIGMDKIKLQEPGAFAEYLREYKNTICGRHPIGVLMNLLDLSETSFEVNFTKYEQSSKVVKKNDSSVSYAAGVVTMVE